jgi:hypothetical protein
VEINRALRRLHPGVVAGVLSGIEAAGGRASQNTADDLLTINDEFSASLVIARCRQTPAGSKWRIKLDAALCPDLTIAVRMAAGNESPLDYYLLPRLDMDEAVLRLCEHNGLSLDAYRFGDLEALYQMAVRVPVRQAA